MSNQKFITREKNIDKSDAYIKKVANKFAVKVNMGKKLRTLGKFSSDATAKLVRDILIENDWNVYYFKENNIFKVGKRFYIFDLIDFKIKFLGFALSYEKALVKLNEKRKIIDEKNNDVIKPSKSNFGDNIDFKEGRFIVHNKIRNKETIFGEFPTIEMARYIRNILIGNKWKLDFFKDNHIHKLGDDYSIFIVKEKIIKFVKSFSSRDMAEAFLQNVETRNFPVKNVQPSKEEDESGIHNSKKFEITKFDNLFISFNKGVFVVRDNSRVFGEFTQKKFAKIFQKILEKYKDDFAHFKKNKVIKVKDNYYVFKSSKTITYFLGMVSSYSEVKTILKSDMGDSNIYKDSSDSDKDKIDSYIHKINGEFVIRNKNDDSFGKFSSYDDAKFVRDILEENNWTVAYFKINPILEINGDFVVFKVTDNQIEMIDKFSSKQDAESKFYDHIFKKHNATPKNINKELENHNAQDSPIKKSEKPEDDIIFDKFNNQYIIQRKMNKVFHIFGSFESYDDAVFVRDILKYNCWNVEYFKKNPVIYMENKFGAFNVFQKTINLIGKADSYEEAKFLLKNEESKDQFIETEFVVRNNGKLFARFLSITPARIIRDELIRNNWNIEYFKENNIFEHDSKFYAFNLIDDEIIFLGVYNDLCEADSILNKINNDSIDNSNLQNNSKDIANSNEDMINNSICESKYDDSRIPLFELEFNENDVDHSFIYLDDKNEYIIKKLVYDSPKVFGKFSSLKQATIVKSLLENNGWDVYYFNEDKIFFSDGNFYIFKLLDGEVKSLGKFDNKESAFKVLNQKRRTLESRKI